MVALEFKTMLMKLPKNSERIHWTRHVKEKMRQYQLSEKRLKRVLRTPERKEVGVAPGTIAIMQVTGTKKHPTEIWLMYQAINSKVPSRRVAGGLESETLNSKQKGKKIRIISAWRYPGRSPIGKPPPIPDDILDELSDIIKNN